jgi:hypothetical protein
MRCYVAPLGWWGPRRERTSSGVGGVYALGLVEGRFAVRMDYGVR